MTGAHLAPPIKPWDALGLFRYARHLKDNWQCPGGLDYERFSSEFVLAVVPDRLDQTWLWPHHKESNEKTSARDTLLFWTCIPLEFSIR